MAGLIGLIAIGLIAYFLLRKFLAKRSWIFWLVFIFIVVAVLAHTL